MKRTIAVSLAAALWFFLFTASLALSGSPRILIEESVIRTNHPIHGSDLGDFDRFGDSGGIQGDLERTVQFEVVPGEEFTFDLTLWNPEEVANSAGVALRLELPNGGRLILYDDEVTLEEGETLIFHYNDIIPASLELYGRYTLKLMIDLQLADFFQFDMNSRGEIICRWDDGVLAGAVAWFDAGNIWAIRCCMPDGAIIDEIGVHLLGEGDPFWPWPNSVHEDIELQIWDDTGPGGLPGVMIWSAVVNGGASGNARAYPGIPALPNAFYVGNHQLTPFDTCEGQGIDAELNHPDQMFVRMDGVWQNAASLLDGDLMAWAIGHMRDGGEGVKSFHLSF